MIKSHDIKYFGNEQSYFINYFCQRYYIPSVQKVCVASRIKYSLTNIVI